MTEIDLQKFNSDSRAKSEENRRFLNRLKKKPNNVVDEFFQEQHVKVFDKINCLNCANCCKTTSPIFKDRDIDRLSKFLKIKPGDLVQNYLKLDEEGDYVLQKAPCPFLMEDNYCSVYEARPRACREYPHTNRKNISQILTLTYKNTLVCPAVLQIVENLKSSEF